jgi:sortase A
MPGTVAVAGHRTTFLAPFRDLDQLAAGDQVQVHMPYADVTYRVDRTQIVAPNALWVTRRTGHDQLVLTACHPRFSASKRIVVFARQVAEQPAGLL